MKAKKQPLVWPTLEEMTPKTCSDEMIDTVIDHFERQEAAYGKMRHGIGEKLEKFYTEKRRRSSKELIGTCYHDTSYQGKYYRIVGLDDSGKFLTLGVQYDPEHSKPIECWITYEKLWDTPKKKNQIALREFNKILRLAKTYLDKKIKQARRIKL